MRTASYNNIFYIKGVFMNKLEHRSTSRALDILQLVANSKNGYTLTQLSDELQAPKSSLFPIIHTLNERRFLSLDMLSSVYRIGPATFQTGMAFLNRIDALKQIEKEMDYIVEQCSETVHFAILDGGNVIYLLKKDSPQAIRMTSTVGLSLPAYGTGIGKALLIDHDLESLKALYPEGLQPITESTIKDFNELERQLMSFRHDDISYEYEESTPHVRCVGVALRKNNEIVAALSIAVPIFRCDDVRIASMRAILIQSKHKMESLFLEVNLDFALKR